MAWDNTRRIPAAHKHTVEDITDLSSGLAYGDEPSDLQPDGTASVGTIDEMARIDHVHPASSSSGSHDFTLDFIIDAGNTAISTGNKGYIEIPRAATITGWVIMADTSGSIVVDVKRCTYSDFPTTASIAGSEKPTLSGAQKNSDLDLTTWTTSVAGGDILEFNVSSASTVKRVTVSLKMTGDENNFALDFIIDGGEEEITTGSKGYVEMPRAATITGWTIVADVSASIVVDVLKCTYSDFPTTASIAGSEKPTLDAAQKNADADLTTWTTSVAAGDILEFNVSSADTVKLVTISLKMTG